MNKRISISEKGLKENKIKNNSLYKNLTNSNSCCNLNYENSLVKMDNNNNNYKYSLKNMKNFYNINDKKKFNIYPPIFDTKINELSKNHNYKTINNLNANNFISSYSKIVKGFKNKNSKIPIKKEFTFFKELRNNSISVIHKEKDESKSILINGKNIDKIDKILNLIKPENKTRNKNLILNSKLYSITVKNNRNLIPKYIQKEMNNIKVIL